jgi:hypothetical protein
VSSLNNPSFLSTVENAIKKLILPELAAQKGTETPTSQARRYNRQKDISANSDAMFRDKNDEHSRLDDPVSHSLASDHGRLTGVPPVKIGIHQESQGESPGIQVPDVHRPDVPPLPRLESDDYLDTEEFEFLSPQSVLNCRRGSTSLGNHEAAIPIDEEARLYDVDNTRSDVVIAKTESTLIQLLSEIE